jgi:DNA primase
MKHETQKNEEKKCSIDKQLIIDNVSIIDVLKYFNIEKMKNSSFMYKCPIHSDKTASLDIRNGIAHCYGCKFTARDSIGMYMGITNHRFNDSIAEMNDIFCMGRFGSSNKLTRNQIYNAKRKAEEEKLFTEYQKARDEILIEKLKKHSKKLEAKLENINNFAYRNELSEDRLSKYHKIASSMQYTLQLIDEVIWSI